MSKVKGMCMTCGLVMTGETRALVEGQFSWHNNEKHRRRLNNMQPLVLRFFEGTPPKLEVRKAKRRTIASVRSEVRKKLERDAEENAVWV